MGHDQTERARTLGSGGPPAVVPGVRVAAHRPHPVGLPDFSKDLDKALTEGTVTLGGCLVTGDDPEWECLGCGQTIQASARPSRRGAWRA